MFDNSAHDLTPQRDELDGVLMLRAALRYGLNVEVYPRQVFTTIIPGDVDLSFVHGLPGASKLGPVTYAQDKRMRRALMERAGIPVPRGATFTMGRGVPGAINFARQLGFPVTITPAIGDNGAEVFRSLRSPSEMERAIDYLRTPTSKRENFTRAAYGLTELREPGEDNGRLVVPPGYMFMVEKDIPGTYLRALVIGEQVASVLRYEDHAAAGAFTGGREMVESVHPTLKDLVQRSAAVIPGLAVTTIDLVVQDPFSPIDGQEVGVVEYSERPNLWAQYIVDHSLGHLLAEQIVLAYSREHGHNLRHPRDEVSTGVEAHAVPDVETYVQAVRVAARDLGVAIEDVRADAVAGVVHMDMSGAPSAIARLTDALLAGKVGEERVMLVVITHRDGVRHHG